LEDLKKGRTVLVSAHGNSLRAITMFVEDISEEEIPKVEIPTGVPIVYTFNEDIKYIEKIFL
jgi:2,3-bisphosphoglycerate-dependent phosphoglycerate mutase